MNTKRFYSLPAHFAFLLLFLSAAAVTCLLFQLRDAFSYNMLVALLIGWSLVVVYSIGVLKTSFMGFMTVRKQQKAQERSEAEFRLKTLRIRRHRLKPVKNVTLRNGHVVNVA